MKEFNDFFGSDKEQNAQAFGLFSFMEEQSKKDNYLEEEMNCNELDADQKGLVKKDEYNSSNVLEAEDLEEDHYYKDNE